MKPPKISQDFKVTLTFRGEPPKRSKKHLQEVILESIIDSHLGTDVLDNLVEVSVSFKNSKLTYDARPTRP